jgi:Zn finger protein HypA/HybF involved in hydrogenase expression
MTQEQSQNKPEDTATDTPAYEAMYDRFTARASELYTAGQEKSREAMEKAMDAARQQLAAASEISAEQGALFKEYMKRDLEQTEQDMRALGKETKEYLHPARLGAGALSSLARMLEATSSALQTLSRKAEESLQYSTGDITTAGTLTCVKCGQTVQLKRTTRIPPCPSCSGTHFRKGY